MARHGKFKVGQRNTSSIDVFSMVIYILSNLFIFTAKILCSSIKNITYISRLHKNTNGKEKRVRDWYALGTGPWTYNE